MTRVERINAQGNEIFSEFIFFRLKLRFSCMLDFTSYPLDRQECYIELATCKLPCFTIINKYPC